MSTRATKGTTTSGSSCPASGISRRMRPPRRGRRGIHADVCGTLGLRDFMKYVVAGMSLGLCFGAAWGAALQNVGLGVALGVALGVPGGLVFSGSSAASVRKNVAADKPSPYPLGL